MSNASNGTTTVSPEIAQAVAEAFKPFQAQLAETLKSIPAAIGEAVKPLNEQIAKLQPATPAAKEGQQPKVLTEADIDARVEARLKAAQDGSKIEQDRKTYIDSKLKNLPETYRNLLGKDPAKFDDEAKSIRERMKTDATAMGFKIPDVAGVATGAAKGAVATVDVANLDKNNSQANIELGLRQAEIKK